VWTVLLLTLSPRRSRTVEEAPSERLVSCRHVPVYPSSWEPLLLKNSKPARISCVSSAWQAEKWLLRAVENAPTSATVSGFAAMGVAKAT